MSVLPHSMNLPLCWSGALAWLPRVVLAHAHVLRALRASVWPLLDVMARLWLAQTFFVSGVIKLTNWQTALYLAAHEYPVSWMDPVLAAYVGVCIEVLAPPMLAIGLATRYAAAPLFALAVVIQFAYQAHDAQLFWIALLAWYLVHGAGPLSFDALLRRGLGDSALPVVPRLVRAGAWLRDRVSGSYLDGVRLWLALGIIAPLGARAESWLPHATFAVVPSALAGVLAVLLGAGLATRYLAVLLALLITGDAMMTNAMPRHIYDVLTCTLLAFHGTGVCSLDWQLARQLRKRFPELDGKPAFALDGLPRVVIVGGGFGGLACAARLASVRVAVTLIDRTNYHLFQPLLYQVATAALSPGDIAAPLRPLFRDAFNTRVLLGTVSGVDLARREVFVEDQRIGFDYLVIATGATHGYFGQDGWSAQAPGLKRIEDATEIRRRLLSAFERAEACHDDDERAALLTVVIVGGGPTGVELAGAIAELARFGMDKDFRRFDPASARVVLVQSAPRLLPTFDVSLSAIAERALAGLGVEVLTGNRVEVIDEHGVIVGGARIAARTVLWAAGVTASPAAQWLGVAGDAAGRVEVGPDLSVPGLDRIFVLGDTAASRAWNGAAVPGLAPAARQGGQYVATVIRAAVEGRSPPPPFRYRHYGSLATIGRKAAVADFGAVKLWGAPAWWLWGAVHVGFLVGVRNRVATMLNWLWAYVTFGSGIRLITGDPPASASSARQVSASAV